MDIMTRIMKILRDVRPQDDIAQHVESAIPTYADSFAKESGDMLTQFRAANSLDAIMKDMKKC